MTWADLDKAQLGKERADGAKLVIVRDDRTAAEMREARYLTTIVAICRVLRAKAAAEARFARTAVIYVVTAPPPDFLADAVAAAGGVVFDGAREYPRPAAMAMSPQLDAAFVDLASAVRRRLGAKTFRVALEVREAELARVRIDPADTTAWWTAIIELVALFGEHLRETRAARWVDIPNAKLPLALDLGGATGKLAPGNLAQRLVEGGAGSMLALITATDAAATSAAGAPMPLLVDRRTVPIDKLTWEPLLPLETDGESVPVIAYVEDHGGTIKWPFDRGAPTAEVRARAAANLAREPFELQVERVTDDLTMVIVTGGFYGAESLLVPARMERVRAALGGPRMMLIGVPERGQLVALDGERATLDDDLRASFLMLVAKHYREATERDRISPEVLVYVEGAVGRLELPAPPASN